jgi:hypothetical protein
VKGREREASENPVFTLRLFNDVTTTSVLISTVNHAQLYPLAFTCLPLDDTVQPQQRRRTSTWNQTIGAGNGRRRKEERNVERRREVQQPIGRTCKVVDALHDAHTTVAKPCTGPPGQQEPPNVDLSLRSLVLRLNIDTSRYFSSSPFLLALRRGAIVVRRRESN